MNKKIMIGLLSVLVLTAGNGFAQKLGPKVIKKLNPVQLERTLARRVSLHRRAGIYIPSGITYRALEKKVLANARKAGIQLNKDAAGAIAYNPLRILQFQKQIGAPLFEKPIDYEEGLSVLNENQKKFAAARANGQYEEQWAAFASQYSWAPYRKNKLYADMYEVATDVVKFYEKYIGLENLPRVRAVHSPEVEGVVCEIPVNGLQILQYSDATFVDVDLNQFVIIRTDDAIPHVEHRNILQHDTQEQKTNFYRVIK